MGFNWALSYLWKDTIFSTQVVCVLFQFNKEFFCARSGMDICISIYFDRANWIYLISQATFDIDVRLVVKLNLQYY